MECFKSKQIQACIILLIVQEKIIKKEFLVSKGQIASGGGWCDSSYPSQMARFSVIQRKNKRRLRKANFLVDLSACAVLTLIERLRY